jgi:formate/nitrite transporter FocA (FNT family)
MSSNDMSTYAVTQAEGRVNIGWGYNFTRGIGCNWLLGLAVYLAASSKDKLSQLVLSGCQRPVTSFWEHSCVD